MTAEIGILNREAVALAADSAVTSGSKIFPSANKIFTLSKFCPVGIMVYGSASFMEVPWEIAVKEYRHQLGDEAFERLEEFGDDFLRFLSSESRLAPYEKQKSHVHRLIGEEFTDLRNHVDRVVELVLQAGPVPEGLAKQLADRLIKTRFDTWKGYPYPDHLPAELRKRIRRKYRGSIAAAKKHFFPDLLTPAASRRLTEIAVNVITKMSDDRGGGSGVVIAGFGSHDLYQSLVHYHVQGMVEGHLKYMKVRSYKIDPSGDNAAVLPFAQGEMVSLFMEGIDPTYKQDIETFIRDLVAGYPDTIAAALEGALDSDVSKKIVEALKANGDKLLKKYDKELEHRRREAYIDPILDVIGMLPKGELASAAETLVNLTSFKRRVSRQAETVGGPIDVAVITKGDGFIWIKRKHYFDPKLNHHFFKNYFPRLEPSEDEGSEEAT